MPAFESSISLPDGRPAIRFVPTGGELSGFSELMGFHRHLLQDRVRTSAFLAAVAATVKPGDVVIDFGTGTGILAMAACRAGASKVYAIDYGGIIDVARALARHNGLAGRIDFFPGDSRAFRIPERADVIVSECLGFMGVGGTMIASLAELAARCLRAGGTVVPRTITPYLVPVESDLHFDYVHAFGNNYGFDFSPANRLAANNVYVATFAEGSFVGDPQAVTEVELVRGAPSGQVSAQLRFIANRECRLHGYCGWFETALGDGFLLSSSPSAPAVVWQQLFLPLEREIPLRAGDILDVNFRINHGTGRPAVGFGWDTRAVRSDGTAVHCAQSTPRSFPGPASE
jgi:protein arginine N-methyltransferase 1